ERVEPDVGLAGRLHKEVAGHADAVDGNAAAAADFDHHDRQRDRDTQTPREDVVEIRVAGVGVVDRVSGKSAFAEQRAGHVGGGGPGHGVGELIELAEWPGDVEVGVGVLRDEERGLVERDLVRRSAHELGETLGRVHVPPVDFASTAAAGDGIAREPSARRPYTARMAGGNGAVVSDGLHDAVSTRLKRANQRVTANRKAIVDALSASPRPMTIPELLNSPAARG